MGVYAPKVKMPHSCATCGFSNVTNYIEVETENGFNAKGGRKCTITGNFMPMYCSYRTRMNKCPLIEVSQHGRLVDVDELKLQLIHYWNVNDEYDFSNKLVWKAIERAPTIIEKESEV